LRRTMVASNITQGELAQRLGISQPAVSQWCSGKKLPNDENFSFLAEILKVEVDWLQKGIGRMKTLDERAERRDYQDAATWGFRNAPPDGGKDYGNANVWSFDPGLEALVREVLQNARDAGLGAHQPVQVVFRIIRLVGEDLRDFQNALQWDALRIHLEASIENGQKLGTLIKDGLREIEDRKELLLLTIEDSGTTGLLGPEKEDGKFSALCRNNLDSKKDDSGTKGGAFGLGKAVLWRASRLSTVLFCSNLTRPNDEGQSLFRLLGRCDLPWHKIGDGQFAGPGWFGKKNPDDDDDAISFWENETLAKDLYLYREASGTTACVVGFHDASADQERKPMELAQELVRAAASHFFPALAFGTLKVSVEVYENRRQYADKQPGFSQGVNVEEMKPHYCRMLRAFREGLNVDQLGEQDEVVACKVVLELPRVKGSKRGGELEHEAILLLAAAGEDGSSEDVNHLAMFRGPGMVIESLQLAGICLGARPFFAMLMCGKAPLAAADHPGRNAPADAEAEEFLRSAEPPSHHKWMATTELKSLYALGCKKKLDDFIRRSKEAVRDLVKPVPKDLGDGPQSLKELFRIGSEPIPTERPRISHQVGQVDEAGRWEVEARIRLKARKTGLRISPAVLFMPETGNGQPVRWETLEPVSNCSCEGHDLIVPPNTREVRFRGRTDPSDHPVPAHESCIVVDLRKVIVVKGGNP
jgi:transcriptional regulator with XRE-family HTH domain